MTSFLNAFFMGVGFAFGAMTFGFIVDTVKNWYYNRG